MKAGNELGRRLQIDKQRLREWREDFARLMREQGIAELLDTDLGAREVENLLRALSNGHYI